MDLARLGDHFQSPLSFVRSNMRQMMNQRWQIRRSRFDLDGKASAPPSTASTRQWALPA
jgi:hypothetical protein